MDLFKIIFIKKYSPTDAERILLSTLNVEEVKRILNNANDDLSALKSLKRYFATAFNAETKNIVNMDKLAMLCYKKYYSNKFELVDLDFVEV